ncbi:hypothetical protein [Leptospira idonii]|uniref:Uncharacterized protein n=1 Tax=Leptospira idonii TaxID=1193500 RepID=A0A4V3JY24_9LEPT|nr:hypothetical protein [Leptospira idonii]TGN19636.1 hypothetical protein EHS15_07580 [Leptospira idonii]
MKTSNLEKSLFSATRVFTTVGILFFLIVTIIATVVFFTSGKDTYVSYEEVKQSLAPATSDAQPKIEDTLPGINIPDNIKETFTGDNLSILYGWLNPLDDEKKQDFLNNLSKVITKAKDNNEDPTDIINRYKELKYPKFASSEFEKYFEKVLKAVYISLAVFSFIIAILLCLILVLLAIERNTRNESE